MAYRTSLLARMMHSQASVMHIANDQVTYAVHWKVKTG